VKLVKVHFWMHNFGLIGMVVFFMVAGLVGGLLDPGEETEKLVSHLLAFVGIFGTLVLCANIIWGFNLYKTAVGWQKRI
jgi:cytochrome c oxidase cbb3-type subunit 1